jgi:archaellum component FlaC
MEESTSTRRQTRSGPTTRSSLRSAASPSSNAKKKDDKRNGAMDSEYQRASQKLDQMTERKDRLANENALLRMEKRELKGELMEARAEVKRLAGRYEAVWKENVLLKEKLSVRRSMNPLD